MENLVNKTTVKSKKVNTNIFKREKAITLIALVITIIVLLILAAVTINTLTGENSLLRMAQNARDTTQYTSAKEMIQLKLSEVSTDCIINAKDFTVTEIAKAIETDENITIEKFYYKETGLIKEGLTSNFIDLEAIVVTSNVSQKYKFLIDGSCGIAGILTEEIKDTTKIEEFDSLEEFEEAIFAGRADEARPKILEVSIANTTNSITINIEDKNTQNATYNYYIKTSENGEYTKTATTNINNEYVFQNLTQNTEYYIKVEIQNENGNKVEKEITGKTLQLVGSTSSTISLSPSSTYWTNGNVTVTASTTQAGYTIETGKSTSSWSKTSSQVFTSNGTMYARIVDSTGQSSGYVTYSVTNIDKTAPSITLTQTNTSSREYSKTISASISGTGSSVRTKKYQYGSRSSSYFSSSGNSFSSSFTVTTRSTSYSISNPPQYTYTVYAEDYAGNRATRTITVQNLLIDNTLTGNSGLTAGSGGTISSSGRITLPVGVSAVQFGPYWNLPGGTYEITYKGTNLQTSIQAYSTYIANGSIYSPSAVSLSSTQVKYRVTVSNYAGPVEFVTYNGSSNIVYIDSVRIVQL